jgi:hypothetical protein
MTPDYPLAMLPHNRELAPWLAQMQGLDLPARRQVLKRFKPTPMPPFLYKYLSSDRELSLQSVPHIVGASRRTLGEIFGADQVEHRKVMSFFPETWLPRDRPWPGISEG